MRSVLFGLLASLSIWPGTLRAQSFHFEKLTEFHGLSDNRVTCFLKDRAGFMWIGTENGLNRYDGFTFQVYRPGQEKHKLSHEHINDIEQDAKGRLWVATWHGLNVLDPASDSLYIFAPDEDTVHQKKTRIASSITWDSYIDKSEKVWLAIDVRDLCYYDPATREFTYFPWMQFVKNKLPQYSSVYKSIQKISRKSDHEIWLGTTLGLFSFNDATKKFNYHGGDAPVDFVGMEYDSTLHQIYFGQDKLYVYDLLKDSLHAMDQSVNAQFTRSQAASGLMLPSSKGLWMIDKITGRTRLVPLDEKTFTLQHEKPITVFKDNRITWIGTSTGIGIHDSNLDVFPFVSVFRDTTQSRDGTIFFVKDQDQSDAYYISSYNRGSLIIMNKQTGTTREISSVNRIPLLGATKIMEDSQHKLWILTSQSILVSDQTHKKFSPLSFISSGINYRFVDMIEDAQGNFWFASLRYGVFYYKPGQNSWRQLQKGRDNFFAHRPTALLSDPEHDAVWISDFSSGISRHDLKTKKFEYFGANPNDPNSLQSSLVNALAIDKQGDVWVATTSGGVSKYSQERKGFTTYSMQTGLPENTVHSLHADLHGNIWVASSKGLTCMKSNGEIIKHYDKNAGLRFTNFRTPFSTNKLGEILIGTANGFLKFHPDSLTVTSADFPVVITSSQQGELPLNHTMKQSFPYNQNDFTFQFAALTYSLPRKVTYFYQLKGYDSDWIDAGNDHTARYTNLSEGDYTFLVKAIDHSGKPSMNVVSIPFTITPPFWKQSWFIAMILISAGTLLFMWIRNLQRKVQIQKILNQLATSLYSQNTIEGVFRIVAKNCCESLHFQNCAVYLFDKEKDVLIQKSIAFSEYSKSFELNNAAKITISAGTAAQTGKAEIIHNVARDKRYAHIITIKASSIITVPIFVEERVFAVITSEHTRKNYYNNWHLQILKEMASICSVKIGRYFIEEQIRSKVARDLHDDMGSTLSSINILSQVAMIEKEGDTENYLQRIGDQSARIMENMSDMVWSINPHNDSMTQVIIRMREFATEILEAQNIEFKFSEEVPNDLIIHTDRRKNLFLIFKETINNAAKYSKARTIEITLQEHASTIVMIIKDNGLGFDEKVIKAGNGLRNIRERAKEVNGTIKLKSVAGEGTELEFSMPIT